MSPVLAGQTATAYNDRKQNLGSPGIAAASRQRAVVASADTAIIEEEFVHPMNPSAGNILGRTVGADRCGRFTTSGACTAIVVLRCCVTYPKRSDYADGLRVVKPGREK
jgi:hypothetical protein